MLLEVQALVTPTAFGMPRRTAAGTDYNRVNLLMAVLEKRCHYDLSHFDAYVNITGGLRMNEPALDLAIIMAIVSSMKDKAVDPKTIIFGEVGLAGEVRAVSMVQQRVNEAKKLGFNTCVMPEISLGKMGKVEGMRLIGATNVREAIMRVMG
jgi:DNA repair protein RadA/Sms